MLGLVPQLLLGLAGLLGRDLHLPYVLTNSLQLVLDSLQLSLCQLSILIGLLLILLDNSGSAHPTSIGCSVVLMGHIDSFPWGFVGIFGLDLIHHGLVLEVVDPLQERVTCRVGLSAGGSGERGRRGRSTVSASRSAISALHVAPTRSV